MGTVAIVINRPQTVADLGIHRNFCEDLAVKILYLEGELSLLDLAHRMCIDLAVMEEIFERLRKGQLCEVKGMTGNVRRIASTGQGKARALDLLALNQYSGPVPVSLEDYKQQVQSQSVREFNVHAADVERTFSHLVIDEKTLAQLGTAVVSGRAIMLYGPPGTGKTAIAESLPAIYGDEVLIPHAVEVDSQIITVYDSHVHEALGTRDSAAGDRRWVACRRPRVVTGGELTAEMLDLQWNPVTRFYSAPLQMKANNGVLIVDDFGRQRIRAEDLLNRWIVPLDRKIDFLALLGGKKFEIPFDMIVVFATNMEPAKLADEAFLRRIQTKIRVDYVSPQQFHVISRGVCEKFGVGYDAAIVEQLIALLAELGQPLRACYPRDIIQSICWAARYHDRTPCFDRDAISQACQDYFLVS
jgi:predicted ATPase with chaperone activity